MMPVKLRVAQAAMGNLKSGAPSCAELAIARQTLYRHVIPKGGIRPNGNKGSSQNIFRNVRYRCLTVYLCPFYVSPQILG